MSNDWEDEYRKWYESDWLFLSEGIREIGEKYFRGFEEEKIKAFLEYRYDIGIDSAKDIEEEIKVLRDWLRSEGYNV